MNQIYVRRADNEERTELGTFYIRGYPNKGDFLSHGGNSANCARIRRGILMPACAHCEYTRCPKCGHDCAKEPPIRTFIVETNGYIGVDGKIGTVVGDDIEERTRGAIQKIMGLLAKPGSGESCES